jgi:hypothetical protein
MRDQRVTKECERCGTEFKCSPSHAIRRKNCSRTCANNGRCQNTGRTHFKKGHKPWSTGGGYKSPEHSERMKKAWEDGKFEDRVIDYKETAKKISITQQGVKKEEWSGFRITENKRLRGSSKYAKWRTTVFERDNYACQNCFKNNCYLEAHHIMPWAKYENMRFNINNGITYCRECHIKIDPNRGKRNLKGGNDIMKNNIIENVC